MPFAFGQTINLSQSSDTRSGITPIKWGFCANDPIGSNFISESVGADELEKWTAALMHIETPCVDPDFGEEDGVTSGNFEPNISPIIKTELGWKEQEINANAQKVILYIITRAGSGAGTILDSNGCSPTCRGANCPLCCCEVGACFTPGDCTKCGGVNTDCGDVETECCGKAGGFGGTAGYYKVTFDLTNHPQENLYVNLEEFNIHSSDPGGDDCTISGGQPGKIRVKLLSDAVGDDGVLLAQFECTPGTDGYGGSQTQRTGCGDCVECPSSCGNCLGTGPGGAPFNFGIADPSTFSSIVTRDGINISITVELETPEDFWGPLNTEGSGHLGTVFGWNEASLTNPPVPDAWTTINFGGGGAAGGMNAHGGAPCTPGDGCNCTPPTGGPQQGAGIFLWEPTADPTHAFGQSYSGQLIGFVVQ